jgi:hypothetical protein
VAPKIHCYGEIAPCTILEQLLHAQGQTKIIYTQLTQLYLLKVKEKKTSCEDFMLMGYVQHESGLKAGAEQ